VNSVEEPRKRGLGRGLSALLGEPIPGAVKSVEVAADVTAADGVRTLPVEYLRPGKYQPRHHFDQSAIDDLTQSVKEKGVIQPLLVRQLSDNLYEIIAGERRWRAAQAAMLHEVPVVVRELTDSEALELALIENLQRQDLTPLEEADGFRRLMDEFQHTQEALAKVIGKSRSHVANMMRLLSLPDPVKRMMDEGSLSAGHARALLTAEDPVGLAKQVVERGLNVRQTEKLAQEAGGAVGSAGRTTTKAPKAEKDTDIVALERSLSNLIGLQVTITTQPRGGELSIHYNTLDQLDEVISRLSGNAAH
jgi:ParB family chromosome partitioning protein